MAVGLWGLEAMSAPNMIPDDTDGDNLAGSVLVGELVVWKGIPLPVFAVHYQNNIMYSGQGFGSSSICSLNGICELTHKDELY